MASIKTKNIRFPLRIEVQDGQINKYYVQNVPIICHSSRLVIDVSQLTEIHPLEANTIISTIASQLSKSEASDYIVFEGAIAKNVEELFLEWINLYTSNCLGDDIIQTISKQYPPTLKPLKCIYSIGYLPNPYKVTDLIAKFTFYREE